MSMTLRVTNLTALPVSIPDVGVVIPASSFADYTDPGLIKDLSVSENLRALVTGLTLSLSDGVNPLTQDDLTAYFTLGGRNTPKGSLAVPTAVGMISLPVGANGRVLTADSSAVAGVSWSPVPGSTLSFRSVAVSGPLLVTDVNTIVLATGGAGGITLTLPNPALVVGGPIYVKKVDAAIGVITISQFAAETIDGAASVGIASQYQSLILVSDGTNWHLI